MSQPTWEPKAVQDIFYGITQLPHPSGAEDPVRAYVVKQANLIPGVEVVYYDPKATEPGDRVIVLSRKGSGSYAGKTPVILQAHMDMVYSQDPQVFPLTVKQDTSHTDGVWIKAQDAKGKECTLGADDGLGVATALAILNDSRFTDYPIECLFTVQEETDMGGAQNCDVTYMKGDKLLNLDAELLTEIIFGSAGGAETQVSGALSRTTAPDGYTLKTLSISGLKGGHSGLDINKCRLNALKAMTQALLRLDKRTTNLDIQGTGIQSYNLLLCNLQRTGIIKSNAIPVSSEAVIYVQDPNNTFDQDFKSYCEYLQDQYLPIETDFSANVVNGGTSSIPLDAKSTDATLCLLQQMPSGVVSMISGVPDVVETSTNLYNVVIADTALTVYASNRSSSDSSLENLNTMQKSIGSIFGFSTETNIGRYVSWQPDYDSFVLKQTGNAYNESYKGSYTETVIHAGLECGVLKDRFKTGNGVDLDCVSIGPTIQNPHTDRECLQVQWTDQTQSVQKFYDSVCMTLTNIFSNS